MLVSLKWLREYLDLPTELDIPELAELLTSASAEVEGIEYRGSEWDSLIQVGYVTDVSPHPDADKLRLATVDYGADEPITVVCGAPNLDRGQRIAFAQAGATVKNAQTGDNVKLKRAKIRGVESSGMVLSEAELGLSDSHDGILVLDKNAPIGMKLGEYLGDVILDVHVWPNRPDMMSMVGIARELAAILKLDLISPAVNDLKIVKETAAAPAIRIADETECQRYTGVVITNLSTAPSPQWMQERLQAAGMRPINSIVDVTNYVMLEIGQPLHAFDFHRLTNLIEVRAASSHETITTIDSIDRSLSTESLVISDGSQPIALAGVMGGIDTEVGNDTNTIFLEAANFNPIRIRRTAQAFNLHSEASRRFERGLSPKLAELAIQRAVQIYTDHFGGQQASTFSDFYPQPFNPPTISFAPNKIQSILGMPLTNEEISTILQALEYEFSQSDELYSVTPPLWRTDVFRVEDVAEDIVRLVGYEKLPAEPIAAPIPLWEPNSIKARDRVVDAFVQAGCQEVISYSLTTLEQLTKIMPIHLIESNPPVALQNPLSLERSVLRTSLRHSILEIIAKQIKDGTKQIAIFEVARVFSSNTGTLPSEKEMVCGAVAGYQTDRWNQATSESLNFFDAKGLVDSALSVLRLKNIYETESESAVSDLKFGMTAQSSIIKSHERSSGVIGEMDPKLLSEFGIDIPVTLFEFDLSMILEMMSKKTSIKIPATTPSLQQDISLVVDESQSAGQIIEIIEESPLVTNTAIFDIYRGEPFEASQKSISIRIDWQAPNKTLTGKEVSKLLSRLLLKLEKETGAIMRT
ncbi:MAG: phenylalanine--tRNA ligase subunit beta [Dehalococcoidia bacterium]|nr:phenylalanine--tRNA ligase subunit beta [Dehalococcoidia bacterium]